MTISKLYFSQSTLSLAQSISVSFLNLRRGVAVNTVFTIFTIYIDTSTSR